MGTPTTTTTTTTDAVTTRLLDLLQVEVPLVERPFAAVARRIGADQGEAIARIRALRAAPRPTIRQISAIFDSKALGYQSTLVAAKVPEAELERAAAVISQHPGVSHNYRREHEYNLWYTLALPPDSRLGLDGTANCSTASAAQTATRLLPTLRLFKIGVKFDFGSESDAAPHRPCTPPGPTTAPVSPRNCRTGQPRCRSPRRTSE